LIESPKTQGSEAGRVLLQTAQVVKEKKGNGDMDFADHLWTAANKLRGSVEAAEYKHIVLGLLFLKYISDAFENRRKWLTEAIKDPSNDEYYVTNATSADVERVVNDRDEYLSANVFYVPPHARWAYLMANAMQPNLGKLIDDGMVAIEKENPRQLRSVLPKIYARATIPSETLGELINLLSQIDFGGKEAVAQDKLGRTYEYFIKMFAKAEGHRGGEFYTPNSVVRLIVEMLEPYQGRIYDPACGSGGMFVQSHKFVQAHEGNPQGISIYGEESNEATWRICKMNLAARGIPNENILLGNTFTNDLHKDLRADFIMANPPFNMKEWGGDKVVGDARLKFGQPPGSNANYMWIQHFIHHLAPNGRTGFVMSNGSLSVGGSEGEIRKKIIEADLVDCIVACPGQLFFTTMIPCCLWFISRNKNEQTRGLRDRRGEALFIDARQLFNKISRVQIEFGEEHIKRIANTYHAWRGEKTAGKYEDVAGFCKSVTLEEVRAHNCVLTSGRYVGAEEVEEEEEPFDQKLVKLTANLETQFSEARRLEQLIRQNLRGLKHD